MRKCDKRIVEEVLYNFPKVCIYLEHREYLMEKGRDPHAAGIVDGGKFTPEQIVVIERKEGDAEYLLLAAAAERIVDAYKDAKPKMREVIYRLFFVQEIVESAAREMKISASYMYMRRNAALAHMGSACLHVYPVFRKWAEAYKNVDKV